MATISNTPRPGYVFDVTDNVWYPIGVGGHSHSEIASTIADAKGDLIAGTAADTVARLAVGTNNHTLIADSAEATGLKYAAGSKATLTTTGDILYASGANTPARLGIGTTGQVLNVASGLPAWSTPASGGGMTSIASGSLSGSSLSLTSISQDYKNLQLILRDFTFSATITNLKGTVNSNTAYTNTGNYSDNSTAGTFAYSGISWMQLSECTMAAAQTDSALIINFYDYTDTTAYKLFDSYSHTIQSNSNNFGTKISGAARTTSAISSITVTLVGGTFSTGTYTLYGVK